VSLAAFGIINNQHFTQIDALQSGSVACIFVCGLRPTASIKQYTYAHNSDNCKNKVIFHLISTI
jgi:hypothetical protein